MRIAIAGFATTVFAFITVATAPFAAATPDQGFLDALADGGVTFPSISVQRVASAPGNAGGPAGVRCGQV